MQIATHHDPQSGKGIYSISKPVKSYRQVKAIVEEMVPWLNENNGKFNGTFDMAYAISHCQVADEPFSFFVLAKEMVGDKKRVEGRNSFKNFFFPSQVIFNAEILEAPEKIDAKIPKRELVKDARGKMTGTQIVIADGQVNNLIRVPDGCMSFPHRNKKNMDRYYRIKVRYQIARKFLGLIPYLSTKEEVCEAVKAHIFQHEIDHANGINIHYGKGKKS